MLRHPSHLSLLGDSNGIERITLLTVRSRAHLDKDETAIVVRHNIELARATAIVARDNPIAELAQEIDSSRLGEPPRIRTRQWLVGRLGPRRCFAVLATLLAAALFLDRILGAIVGTLFDSSCLAGQIAQVE